METVKMDANRVKLAIEAVGGKNELALRLDRTVRQVGNYLSGGMAQRIIQDEIERIIREYERKNRSQSA
jgi:hypothetical protein